MKIKIRDIEVKYHVFHRKVKYARLEIKNGELNIILPLGVEDYHGFLNKHDKWIYEKISRTNNLKNQAANIDLNFNREDKEFRELVKVHVNTLSQEMNLTVNKVSFRRMKTRWGSCSSSGNININSRLKYLPESLIKYVVHHEMCHLKIRKHDKNYWNLVSVDYPDYKKYEEELSVYWFRVKDLN